VRAKVAALVVLGLAVAAGTLWLLRSPAPADAPAAAPIVPAEIVSIRVTGESSGLARRRAPGDWVVTLGATGVPWPASTGAVRSALRAAAEIVAIPGEPPAGFVPETTLRFLDGSGGERVFEFAGAVIGGRRAVTIDGAVTVSAPAALTDLLLAGAPAGWRDRAAFPGFGAEIDRLLIEQPPSGDQPALEIDLTRAGGRWLLASPHLARADRQAVDAAIARVLGATIERFIDEPRDGALTGVGDPVFVITIEAGDASRRVRFGAQASASGLERFATTGEEGVLFVVDTTLLRELRLDPAAYTDRRPTAVVPADVAALSVAREGGAPLSRAERTLDGWSVTGGELEPARLLERLTSESGVTVAFETPAGWAPIATVTLEDLAGDPLDVLTVGRDESGGLHVAGAMPGGGPVYFRAPGLAAPSLGLEPARE